ncbi:MULTISPECIES: hypothetical protein [unclassified Psychrobacter]|uniref:hypothetical protein n=1 Tax=unclassified Psychrobacter TaxID=196806 RepID=UPI0025B5DA56|nr:MULTISPECIES: hypothetical protein [unclassified Psychrobacter]MDN3452827.1 hypothetical protein [Psychrobacter sp. APC 3350]MDN3502752.1 hypothetical protein [Psychrobacter sp. 5A.1]
MIYRKNRTDNKGKEMNKRWGFWTLWVCISAVAGFVWGVALTNNSWLSIAGMASGIGCFIVFYTLLDDFARKNQWHRFIAALQKGVYIKAGLQILNFAIAIPISPFISPEILAGMGAFYVYDFLGLSDNQPFLSNFIMTLTAGALLSLCVGVISLIILLVSNKKAHAITTNDMS